MIKILLFIALAFSASATAETVEISNSGLWYSHGLSGEQPKYSSAMATGTNKVIPVGVRANGENYYTYSDCVNGQYRIYVKNDTQKTILSRSNYCDPHDNAAIRVASDGYVFVYKSARSDYRKSYVYKSLAPYDISSFEIISSGYKAYPQAWSMGLLYTKYLRISPENALRELWITTTQNTELKLVEGGHYAVSFYDGVFIHMFYNWHKNDDLDNRGGIYYMRSSNGINWQNKSGQALNLPVIPDSSETRITPHDGTLIYLKDMKIVNGLPILLYSKSTSALPGVGTRELWQIDVYGNEDYITNQEHNYDGATYFGHSQHIIAAVKGRDAGYAGGDISFMYNGAEIGGIFNGQANNYPRKVINFRGFIYGETESSQYDAGVKVNLFK